MGLSLCTANSTQCVPDTISSSGIGDASTAFAPHKNNVQAEGHSSANGSLDTSPSYLANHNVYCRRLSVALNLEAHDDPLKRAIDWLFLVQIPATVGTVLIPFPRVDTVLAKRVSSIAHNGGAFHHRIANWTDSILIDWLIDEDIGVKSHRTVFRSQFLALVDEFFSQTKRLRNCTVLPLARCGVYFEIVAVVQFTSTPTAVVVWPGVARGASDLWNCCETPEDG